MKEDSGPSDGLKHQLADLGAYAAPADRHFEFVTLVCGDGLELDAFWLTPSAPRATVIHIHGKEATFTIMPFCELCINITPPTAWQS